jgi:hypothetical protein
MGRPQRVLERSVTAEQHLVEPNRCDLANSVRILDQRPTMVVHGIHPGVPVAAQIDSDFRHCSAVMADLARRPPAGSVGDPSVLGSDPLLDLNEGDNDAGSIRSAGSPSWQLFERQRQSSVLATNVSTGGLKDSLRNAHGHEQVQVVILTNATEDRWLHGIHSCEGDIVGVDCVDTSE